MATSHVIIEGIYGVVEVGISVLSIHIVGAAPRVVLDPDTEVLDVARILLAYLVAVKDLASSLLHLVHLVKEVPETRLGPYLILSKDFLRVEEAKVKRERKKRWHIEKMINRY